MAVNELQRKSTWKTRPVPTVPPPAPAAAAALREWDSPLEGQGSFWDGISWEVWRVFRSLEGWGEHRMKWLRENQVVPLVKATAFPTGLPLYPRSQAWLSPSGLYSSWVTGSLNPSRQAGLLHHPHSGVVPVVAVARRSRQLAEPIRGGVKRTPVTATSGREPCVTDPVTGVQIVVLLAVVKPQTREVCTVDGWCQELKSGEGTFSSEVGLVTGGVG